MSGERGPAAALLWLLLLWSFAGEAAERPERAATSAGKAAPRAAPLRQPRAVHERLQAICRDAGFGNGGYRACAEAITRACGRAGLRPDTPRCWQWLVDRDAGGQLDRRSLKAGRGRRAGRN